MKTHHQNGLCDKLLAPHVPVLQQDSTMLSLWTLITGMAVDYSHHCHSAFCDYVQMHEQHNNTITQGACTPSVLWLCSPLATPKVVISSTALQHVRS